MKSDPNIKADRTIIGAFRSLGLMAPNVGNIIQTIRNRDEIKVIRNAMLARRDTTQSLKQKGKAKGCVIFCDCDACIAEFVRIRIVQMKDSNGQRSILSTGGAKGQKRLVYLEGMKYEATQPDGIFTREQAIEILQSVMIYRLKQVNENSSAYQALKDMQTQLEDSAHIDACPPLYKEVQDTLFSAA